MKKKLVIILIWAFAVGVLAVPTICRAQSVPSDNSQKTEIEADRLVTNNAQKYAEFIGNVRAAQGNYHLSADNLRIYYAGEFTSLKQSTPAGSDDLQIIRIIATGNVHIVSEEYTVDTSRAEYEVATQIMTLTGVDSKVAQGKNTLIGSKITIFQADGRVKVDGEGGKRVKVIFFPEGNEADFFKKPKDKTKE